MTLSHFPRPRPYFISPIHPRAKSSGHSGAIASKNEKTDGREAVGGSIFPGMNASRSAYGALPELHEPDQEGEDDATDDHQAVGEVAARVRWVGQHAAESKAPHHHGADAEDHVARVDFLRLALVRREELEVGTEQGAKDCERDDECEASRRVDSRQVDQELEYPVEHDEHEQGTFHERGQKTSHFFLRI